MGAGHGHGPAEHAGGRHRWRLGVAFVLVGGFFLVELVAGLLTGSLALLSDAGHMAADVVTLGAALVATAVATRPDATGRRTYGSYRAEVFASGFAVLVMLGVSAYVVAEAVARAGERVTLQTGPVLVVGLLGLAVNLVSLVMLRAGAAESLNVRGAYLEVLADTAGSVGVVVAALLVRATGDSRWDTAVALAIGVFVAVRAVALGRQVLADLEGVTGVRDVHDLHLWTLTSGMHVATAHLVADDEGGQVLTSAAAVLRERHGIAHATLQVEPISSRACHELDW